MVKLNVMKAALHTNALHLDLVEKEIPRILDPDHVLLKVVAVGFCGSDKHDLETAPRVEQTPGHEFAGVIEQLGSEPGEFRVGDRVVCSPRAFCGVCANCQDRPNKPCEKGGVYGCRGVQNPPGAMAEYVLVRTCNLTKVPNDVSLEEACFVDPLAVAVHAVNLGPDVTGETCVIMGAGVIGLLLAQVLKLRGAKSVVLVDISQSHLEVGKLLGDFETCLATDQNRLVSELTNKHSSIYYELAGGESPTLDIAIQCIERDGFILLISQRPKGVWLNYQWVMGKQLTLKGVSGHTDEAWEEAVHLICSHKMKVAPLITHRYPLTHVNEALMTAINGNSLKVLLKPNGDIY